MGNDPLFRSLWLLAGGERCPLAKMGLRGERGEDGEDARRGEDARLGTGLLAFGLFPLSSMSARGSAEVPKWVGPWSGGEQMSSRTC